MGTGPPLRAAPGRSVRAPARTRAFGRCLQEMTPEGYAPPARGRRRPRLSGLRGGRPRKPLPSPPRRPPAPAPVRSKGESTAAPITPQRPVPTPLSLLHPHSALAALGASEAELRGAARGAQPDGEDGTAVRRSSSTGCSTAGRRSFRGAGGRAAMATSLPSPSTGSCATRGAARVRASGGTGAM